MCKLPAWLEIVEFASPWKGFCRDRFLTIGQKIAAIVDRFRCKSIQLVLTACYEIMIAVTNVHREYARRKP
jgi:hypothetical protein